MTQNIYDRPDFFQAYGQLERSVQGLAGAPEWPSLRALLPAVRGLRVLDLGCGYGWFCRWAREQGAARVVGLDVSEKMIERARTLTSEGAVEYLRGDLERPDFAAQAFDLVFSSLALHYVENLAGLLATVARVLAPGGQFTFSVEHPLYTAPTHPSWIEVDGRMAWPVDGYLAEGPRITDWLAAGVVKQHRTLGTYLNQLVGAGFEIAQVEEWGPSARQIALRPEWAVERERPMFLLIDTRWAGRPAARSPSNQP
jgi:SAM-dependent methyltransferase